MMRQEAHLHEFGLLVVDEKLSKLLFSGARCRSKPRLAGRLSAVLMT
jgi:hypothetical protein